VRVDPGLVRRCLAVLDDDVRTVIEVPYLIRVELGVARYV
jgi:hypothetical protein